MSVHYDNILLPNNNYYQKSTNSRGGDKMQILDSGPVHLEAGSLDQ